MENKKKNWLSIALCAISLAATLCLLGIVLLGSGGADAAKTGNPAVAAPFDMRMTDAVSDALENVLSTPKVYWLSGDDQIAPEPNPACYGSTDDPSTLQWLFEEAAQLLEGQETYFTTQTTIIPGTEVTYYLDPTIFAVTWKEKIDGMTYTISEVKIADASQFRRCLAGGAYGSDQQLTTSEMANAVNAVVASAGDFYTYRQWGVVVYDGELRRMEGRQLDTCFVDESGDLIFVHAGELLEEAETNRFLEEKGIRFSLAFGPVLIENGERCENWDYPLGEVKGNYSRAGIGQRDELHYMLTTVNSEFFHRLPSISQFAAGLEQLGCDKFYALDGGQTATIVMNDQVVNNVDYGDERAISDIIYFATAIPNGG